MNKNSDYHPARRTNFLRCVSFLGIFVAATASSISAGAQSNSTSGSTFPAVKEANPARTVNSDNSDANTSESGLTNSSDTRGGSRGVAAVQGSNASSSPRFFCQMWKGQFTVMYSPEKRTSDSYPWAVPQELGGGWTAEKRCVKISRRLEEYRPDGLQEMSTTTENGYNTVCATTQLNAACRIVFTVPPGQDPITTRNAVFENLTTADNGQMTHGVNTFAESGSRNLSLNGDLVNLGLAILGKGSNTTQASSNAAINLKPFLAPSDGGTGAKLTNGVRLQKGLRLNPANFR